MSIPSARYQAGSPLSFQNLIERTFRIKIQDANMRSAQVGASLSLSWQMYAFHVVYVPSPVITACLIVLPKL
jgi:hypothetical protein